MSSRTLCRVLPWTVLLAGCTVGPDYARPESGLPAAFPEGAGAPDRGGVAADWWLGFGEPELTRLVGRALAANTDVRAAAARWEEADAQLADVAGAGVPAIDATGEADRFKVSSGTFLPVGGNAPGRNRRMQRAGLVTSFELDFWGRLRRAEEAARAQMLAAEEGVAQVRLGLAVAVVRTYSTLRTADASAAAAETLVAAREEGLRLARRRTDLGVAVPAEAARAEVALAAAVAGLAEARRTRAQAEHFLGFLTAEPALVVPRDARPLPSPPLPAAGLPSDLLSRRPDVRAAEQALIAANARIGFTKAARYPSFTLTGALGTESRTFGGLFQSETATSDLGLDLRAPLFDAGRLAARVDAAIAAQHQAVAAYEGAARNAFREVRDALAEVRETALAAEAADRRETAAAEVLRVAAARGAAGQAPPTELLEARRAQAESQLAVARVRQERLEAQLALIRSLGGSRPDLVPPVR